MKMMHLKTKLTLALITAGVAALPAQAVEIAFTGGSNIGNLTTVTGDDGIGDAWQTHNGSLGLNSNFAMSDFNATPQPFNPVNFSNGFGSFANAFQFTINNSQAGLGFRGISQAPMSSGLINNFTVKPDPDDVDTWIAWIPTYNLLDSGSGLFQQVLFTAPAGTQLDQGENFSLNINLAGIFTADSGWAASFDDRAAPAVPPSLVAEPGSLALLGLGLLGLGGMVRRKRS